MIVLFDLDSTLVKIEGFDEIARRKGIYDRISDITTRTMNGEMPFANAFAQKLAMLAPSRSDAKWLVELCFVHLEDSAIDTIKILKQNKNTKVGILSNGLDIVVKAFGKKHGFDENFCIGVKAHFDEMGNFIDLDQSDPLTRDGGKGEVIKSIKSKLSKSNSSSRSRFIGGEIPSGDEKVVFIGDSAGDMEAGKSAHLFIGYGGVVERKMVVKGAKYFARSMTEVYDLIMKL